MSAYTKLFAAIGATLISRWLIATLGIDVQSLGVAVGLQDFVGFVIDAGVAAFTGFWVWLLPNKKKPS